MTSAATLPRRAEILVIGAGIVGTAIAARLSASGLDVCVVDRAGAAAGTSSAGEGNLLVSDKLPGPELAVALRGVELWRQLAKRAGERLEFETKGGLVVAHDERELGALWDLAQSQQRQGARVELVTGAALREREPSLSEGLPGGVFYEQDCQLQPVLAVDFHLAELIDHGGRFVAGVDVVGAEHDSRGVISAVRTTGGAVGVDGFVVNAAGPWAGEVARRLGRAIPVEPRRGHVLVTEPVPVLVRHKVFEASYVGSIHEGDHAAGCSSVIEATMSGTILLGSSREFVGFSHRLDPGIVATIAARAVALFPVLERVRLMRAYVGFRPATPDRLPIIGPDPVVGGLLHATGHEGAGIGLSEVTAEIVEAIVLAKAPPLDIAPFAPSRFPTVPEMEPRPRGARGPGGASRLPEGVANRTGSFGSPVNSRGQLLHFRFDGRDLFAPHGTTVAGALLGNGERAWRTTRTGDQKRGLFCGIGTCFDCLVDLNGDKAVRSCVALLREGDEVCRSDSLGGGLPGSPGRGRQAGHGRPACPAGNEPRGAEQAEQDG